MPRMTPAKLLLLMEARRDLFGIQEMPLAEFKCMFYNAHRDSGDEKTGRAAAPALKPSDFQTFKRRGKQESLAAKDLPGGRHNLDGAVADKGKWEAWAKGKSRR